MGGYHQISDGRLEIFQTDGKKFRSAKFSDGHLEERLDSEKKPAGGIRENRIRLAGKIREKVLGGGIRKHIFGRPAGFGK